MVRSLIPYAVAAIVTSGATIVVAAHQTAGLALYGLAVLTLPVRLIDAWWAAWIGWRHPYALT